MLNNISIYKTKNLNISYLIALSLIALLSISVYTLMRATLYRQASDAPVINLSGRQRMFSQKLAKEVLLLVQSQNIEMKEQHRQLLSTAIASWTQVYNGLRYGDKELKLSGNNSQEIQNLFAKIAPYHQTIKSAVDSILLLDSTNFIQLSPHSPLVQDILNASPLYLKWMDRIVFRYEKEAWERVDLLKRFGTYILTAVLFLLLLETLFIFRPMVNKVRKTYENFQKVNEELKQEVTERKRVEEELKKAYQELKDIHVQLLQAGKMAAMGEIAAGVAHELSHPLFGIKGFISAIQEDLKCLLKIDTLTVRNARRYLEQVTQDVKVILEQSDRMTMILNNVRDFARSSGKKKVLLSINEPIEAATTLFSEQLRVHNIVVEKDLAEGLPRVKGNANQLQQVLINLITNARDAIYAKNEKKGKLHISTKVSPEKDYVLIEVRDNGIGVDSETGKRMFEPFFTTKGSGKGTGLGLSIVARIIDDHRGKIEADCELDRGCKFSIWLPIVETTERENRGRGNDDDPKSRKGT